MQVLQAGQHKLLLLELECEFLEDIARQAGFEFQIEEDQRYVLLELSGNQGAIAQGFQALRAGGRASLLGIPSNPVSLDLVNDVIFKGATVQGIYGRRMFETWVQMTSLLKAGRLDLEPLFGERTSLEKFEEAFSLLQGGHAGKVLFYPIGKPR